MSGVLLSMQLGDEEQLRVVSDGRFLYLASEFDGCESTTVLDQGEALRLRDVLTTWLERAS